MASIMKRIWNLDKQVNELARKDDPSDVGPIKSIELVYFVVHGFTA